MIYLDNAATTMHKPQEMIEAVVHAMGSLGNAGRGANTASLGAARIIYEARERLARLFGADEPKQIAFTLNSTESLNTAIRGLLGSGDHVITTMLEHNSVLRPLYDLQDAGTDVTFVKADEKGRIRYEDIEEAIRPKTKAIVTTHGSNLTGNMLDVGRIGKMAHDHGLLYIVDASQTAGVFPIDVKTMHIDVLCFTGHKGLLGPQGTGGLYVREGLTIHPLKSGEAVYRRTATIIRPRCRRLWKRGHLTDTGLRGSMRRLPTLNVSGWIRSEKQSRSGCGCSMRACGTFRASRYTGTLM